MNDDVCILRIYQNTEYGSGIRQDDCEDGSHCLTRRHGEERGDEAIHSYRTMDCFAEPVIARAPLRKRFAFVAGNDALTGVDRHGN
jgi:hypothetical protein